MCLVDDRVSAREGRLCGSSVAPPRHVSSHGPTAATHHLYRVSRVSHHMHHGEGELHIDWGGFRGIAK